MFDYAQQCLAHRSRRSFRPERAQITHAQRQMAGVSSHDDKPVLRPQLDQRFDVERVSSVGQFLVHCRTPDEQNDAIRRAQARECFGGDQFLWLGFRQASENGLRESRILPASSDRDPGHDSVTK